MKRETLSNHQMEADELTDRTPAVNRSTSATREETTKGPSTNADESTVIGLIGVVLVIGFLIILLIEPESPYYRKLDELGETIGGLLTLVAAVVALFGVRRQIAEGQKQTREQIAAAEQNLERQIAAEFALQDRSEEREAEREKSILRAFSEARHDELRRRFIEVRDAAREASSEWHNLGQGPRKTALVRINLKSRTLLDATDEALKATDSLPVQLSSVARRPLGRLREACQLILRESGGGAERNDMKQMDSAIDEIQSALESLIVAEN